MYIVYLVKKAESRIGVLSARIKCVLTIWNKSSIPQVFCRILRQVGDILQSCSIKNKKYLSTRHEVFFTTATVNSLQKYRVNHTIRANYISYLIKRTEIEKTNAMIKFIFLWLHIVRNCTCDVYTCPFSSWKQVNLFSRWIDSPWYSLYKRYVKTLRNMERKLCSCYQSYQTLDNFLQAQCIIRNIKVLEI